ncbi:MAG: hypothetical protein PHZ04_04480 [Patescibacteria group bacterium]|nr:hypothetical protein [Patescibacteria group bacterium]MDD5295228.1 hypothetical protein [Patescibacteria group bacterium]MDD5554834.1 hypothetical protein [Patescibacteria group bacterium]
MDYSELVQSACDYALRILRAEDKIKFRPMRRKIRVDPGRGFVIGRTNLKTGLITIDIFTPRKREPKKMASILRTLCHEVAHYQKMPYRQFYKRHWISRQHYPQFYKQVEKNIKILKDDKISKRFFIARAGD